MGTKKNNRILEMIHVSMKRRDFIKVALVGLPTPLWSFPFLFIEKGGISNARKNKRKRLSEQIAILPSVS